MEYLKIGKIINTKGIKGELRVKPLTDFQTDRYKKGNTIYVFFGNEYLEFKVKSYKPYKNLDLLILNGYEDINLVEKYKGSEIFVTNESETTLYDDEYHISEILDLDVYQGDKLIGVISDVIAYPQGDYIEIESAIDKIRKIVPFRDEFILETNLEEGYLVIIEMEGLL